MKLHILYNPLSGELRDSDRLEYLSFLFAEIDEVIYTDMTEITDYELFFREISPEDQVLLCGGDGTLHRFINFTEGLSLPENLWYHATGTGNDFARDTVLMPENAKIALHPYLEHLPTVTVNGVTRRFINNVGFGIDGYCTRMGDDLRAKGQSEINYTSIAIKGMLGGFRPIDHAIVIVDGKTFVYDRVWLAPTMHGRYYGGGMMPVPEQDRLNPDHTVSVMIMHTAGRWKTLAVFPGIFKGKHVTHKEMVGIHSGHEITVRFDRPTPLQIDGETIEGVTEYTVHSGVPHDIE